MKCWTFYMFKPCYPRKNWWVGGIYLFLSSTAKNNFTDFQHVQAGGDGHICKDEGV